MRDYGRRTVLRGAWLRVPQRCARRRAVRVHAHGRRGAAHAAVLRGA